MIFVVPNSGKSGTEKIVNVSVLVFFIRDFIQMNKKLLGNLYDINQDYWQK